jgi:hypothetical protein
MTRQAAAQIDKIIKGTNPFPSNSQLDTSFTSI